MSKRLTLRSSWFVPIGLLAFAAVVMAPAAANATPYTVKLVQQGTNVVAVGSGSIDLTGLIYGFSSPAGGPDLNPSEPIIETGPGGVSVDLYVGFIAAPSNFGSGGDTPASSGSQDEVAVSPFLFGTHVIVVPAGYVSDDSLSSTAIWDNATFASLGVSPGTYRWAWGFAPDQSFTLSVGNMASVPEPAALGIFCFGVLLIGTCVALRRRFA